MTGRLALRVTEVVPAAPDVVALALRAADGTALPSFAPGSHLVLDCGGRHNAYSLTGPGLEPEEYRISVLRRAGGAGSGWVHALAVGALVTASVPRSAFAPVASARRHLLVAGGIGVTAMLAHARAAVAWQRPFTLLYSHRPGRGAHLAELRRLCGEHLVELHGRAATTAALRAALADQPLGTHLYACGPAGLLDAVTALARAAGWPDGRVHLERFVAEALPAARPFTAQLASSGARIPVPGGTSLLEALEGAGAAVPSRCRRGVCGACRIGVLAGRPEHRDLFLDAGERAAGDSVVPCVSRSLDDVLVVDR